MPRGKKSRHDEAPDNRHRQVALGVDRMLKRKVGDQREIVRQRRAAEFAMRAQQHSRYQRLTKRERTQEKTAEMQERIRHMQEQEKMLERERSHPAAAMRDNDDGDDDDRNVKNNVGSGVDSGEEVTGRRKTTKHSLADMHAEAKQKREDARRRRRERAEEHRRKQYEHEQSQRRRQRTSHQLMKRTRKGQPIMQYQLEHVLRKVEKSTGTKLKDFSSTSQM